MNFDFSAVLSRDSTFFSCIRFTTCKNLSDQQLSKMASKGKAPETKNLLPKSDGDAKGAAAPAADGGADGGDKKNAKLDQVEQQVKDTQAKLQQTM